MNQLTFELRSGKYYYHYPFPVAIIGVKVDEKVNFMSAACIHNFLLTHHFMVS